MSIVHVSKLLNEPEEEKKWLVDRLIPEGGITVISGDPASFKTWSVLHIAICISAGTPVFGEFATKMKNVLVIEEEDTRSSVKERIKMLGVNHNAGLYFQVNSGFKVDDEFGLEFLKTDIKASKIDVVFIDSLVRIHSGDENASKDMSAVFEKLHSLTKMGVTVVMIHHHRKSTGFGNRQSLRGSSDILAAVDCHISLDRRDDSAIKITQHKLRAARELSPFWVDIKSSEGTFDLTYREGDMESIFEKGNKMQIASKLIVEILEDKDSVERSEMVSLCGDKGVGQNAVDNAIKSLQEKGELFVERGEKGRKILSLSE